MKTKFSLLGLLSIALILIFCPRSEAQGKVFLENTPLVKKLQLSGECHSQGIALDENYLYLSCVAKKSKRALLYRLHTKKLNVEPSILDLTRGTQYHPSGLDLQGHCLWVAVAEYHPAPAHSTIICIDRNSFQPDPKQVFEIPDHIGALAGMKNWLVAMNWDAREFYLLDYSGKLVGRGKNPSKIAYQDCKNFQDEIIICSGNKSLFSKTGFVDLIQIPDLKPESWSLKTRIVVPKIELKTIPLTREGMAYFQNKLYFLPEDFPNPKLYQFEFPQLKK